MNESINKSISDSLETEETLLPYMPYLLQDLWAMGSSVDQIITLISSLKFRQENPRALDLGCGKGAVSVQIAARYGYEVVGVDAMPEFLTVAREKAAEWDVTGLTSFVKQDIRDFVKTDHQFDLVILAALGGVFGTISETVASLRRQVSLNGYIIIDDGYLKHRERLQRKGYGYCRDRHTTLNQLQSHHDRIVAEVSTNEFSKKINDEYLHVIKKRAKTLGDKHPEIVSALQNYIQLQIEECEIIDRELEGVIWALRKEIS